MLQTRALLIVAAVTLVACRAQRASERAPAARIAAAHVSDTCSALRAAQKAEEDSLRRLATTAWVPELPRDSSLVQASRAGVAAEFYVDPSGKADVRTLRILAASNPAYAEAVRANLSNMHFAVEETVPGCKVRKRVQQPFAFGVARP